ncbi:hypothetical protein CTI12_AA103220 [Artemisia annua]|uniref:Uncharacterized protein n=1 Tax=Artemisia annua TaxID=35608 RepID=A0A2U1PWR8_ARTAN|nr:hypothetical protein CTI12_AA103220 [Artemisia annua]
MSVRQGKRHNGNREFYNGKSYGTDNVNPKSSASFMFHNYPDTWEMGNLWMVFKKYGTVYDMFMIWIFKNIVSIELLLRSLHGIKVGNEYLRVYKAYDRRVQGNIGGMKGQNREQSMKHDMNSKERNYSERDSRKYSEVLGGKRNSGNATEVKQGVADHKPIDVRVIEVKENEVEKEMLSRGIIGEVKKFEYLEKLPELCEVEGLFNVEVKYLGGLEVMMIVDTLETVDNVLRNIEHGIRRWVCKMRKWDEQIQPSGRFTWLSIIGVPVSCWNEHIFRQIAALHGMVMETQNCSLEGNQSVTVGRVRSYNKSTFSQMYKVSVVEEVSDIIEIEAVLPTNEEEEYQGPEQRSCNGEHGEGGNDEDCGDNNSVAMDSCSSEDEDDKVELRSPEYGNQNLNLEDEESCHEKRCSNFKVDDVALNGGKKSAGAVVGCPMNIGNSRAADEEKEVNLEGNGWSRDSMNIKGVNVDTIDDTLKIAAQKEEAQLHDQVEKSAQNIVLEEVEKQAQRTNKYKGLNMGDNCTSPQQEEIVDTLAHNNINNVGDEKKKKSDIGGNNNIDSGMQEGLVSMNIINNTDGGNDIDDNIINSSNQFNKKRKVSMGGSYEKCSHVNGKGLTKEQDRGGQKTRRGSIKLAKIAVRQKRRRSSTGGTSANSKGQGSSGIHKGSHTAVVEPRKGNGISQMGPANAFTKSSSSMSMEKVRAVGEQIGIIWEKSVDIVEQEVKKNGDLKLVI